MKELTVVLPFLGDKDEALRAERQRICVRQLYAWCAFLSGCMALVIAFDSAGRRLQQGPYAEHYVACASIPVLLAVPLLVRCSAAVRPYAECVLGLGTVLATVYFAWVWERALTAFTDEINRRHPYLDAPLQHLCASPAPMPPGPAGGFFYFVFGLSPADFLAAGALFSVVLGNTMQMLCVVRMPFATTAATTGVSSAAFVLWPLLCGSPHPPFWFFRIYTTAAATASVWYLSYTLDVALRQQVDLLHRVQRAAEAEVEAKYREAGQKADSILNHILKNTMADAMGCIDLYFMTHRPGGAGHLSKATDILFRGMWWCKLREAMLKIVAGSYDSVRAPAALREFVAELVRGRELATDCCAGVVRLDAIACNIVLDNAITNAWRHGCPGDPQVALTVRLADPGPAAGAGPMARRLRFLVTNRADPGKAAQREAWSSEAPDRGFQKDGARAVLSDGLGLQHIALVARTCGMVATLWQEGDQVLFELCVDTELVPASDAAAAAPAPVDAPPFPPGLSIMCLDDSAVARESLGAIIPQKVPTAAVVTFGRDAEDAARFQPAALAGADIVILDQNVDIPGRELLGTDVARELLADGYRGFLCIRSANDMEQDRELTRQSGAHWHVGKEVPIPRMVEMLRAEYHRFLSDRVSETCTEALGDDLAEAWEALPNAVPSGE